MKDTNLIVHS